jgi:quinolinate synthase
MIDMNENLISEIDMLRQEKNAVILAHYYQRPEIQSIADFTGDSLALSQKAAETNADMIVFAGVYFMAETAKILNPGKKVLIPDINAGCSLADSCSPELFFEFIKEHPGHVVVSYINCSIEIKVMSDIICTSSNAERVINSIPKDLPVIFAPDKNLGKYLIKKTGRDMLLWDGSCIVHEAFAIDKLINLYKDHSNAKIIAHPESEEQVLDLASYIGSTAGMIEYVKNDPCNEFIIATEGGILFEMQKEAPGKTLIPAPSFEDNTCSCSECAFMKLNDLEKLYLCMKNESPEILIPEDLRLAALKPIKRMMEV